MKTPIRPVLLFALVVTLGLASALSGSVPVLAQTSLPNRYTSEDGSLSFAYPKGWLVEEEDASINLGQSEAVLDASSPSNDVPSGQYLIQFAQRASLPDLGIEPDSTPEEAAQAVLNTIDVTAEVVPYEGGPDGSLMSAFEGGAWDDPSLLIVLNFPERLVLVAVRLGDAPGDYETLLSAIVESIEVSGGASAQATLDADGLLHQWASDANGSSQYSDTSWNFLQATGAPDTFECGDIVTAWASATGTGEDSLALFYDVPVIAAQINIYQTYNPGAIVEVEVGNRTTGESVYLIGAMDPPGNTECPGVFSVDVQDVTFPVDTVVIHLDQSLTNNWNEIDAVELVGIPAEAIAEPVATAEATRPPSK